MSASVRLSYGARSGPDHSGMIFKGLPQCQSYTEIGRKQVMTRIYQGNFDKLKSGKKKNYDRKNKDLRNLRNRQMGPGEPVPAVAFLGMCIETAR